MKNFVQPGLSVPLPMPYDRSSGQSVLVGALFGVVAVDALSGVTAEVAVNGVFDITVNRRSKMTPDRRPNLTPLWVSLGG